MGLKHIYKAMKKFDPNNVVVKENFARFPISFISKGKKKGYQLYFPKRFLNELKKAKVNYSYDYAEKNLIYKRVSAKTLRKWHFNFMIVDNDIPEAPANFIQGRSPTIVGSANYLEKIRKADKEYAKIVDKFPI